jgi:two-component system LytT family response regulator
MEPLKKRVRTLVIDDEATARESVERLLAGDPDIELRGTCADGVTALAAIEREKPDLILLDVQMPEMNGFELLAELRRRHGERGMPFVIFITAYDRFALRAFEVHAVDYLLKPFGDSRFFQALEHAKERIEAGGMQHLLVELLRSQRNGKPAHRSDRITLKAGGKLALVDPDDVVWFEASDHYIRVHTASEPHLIRKSMAELEEELDPERFVRIHRGAIVNADHVAELRTRSQGESELTLSCGTQLQVSRRRLKELKNRLGA